MIKVKNLIVVFADTLKVGRRKFIKLLLCKTALINMILYEMLQIPTYT